MRLMWLAERPHDLKLTVPSNGRHEGLNTKVRLLIRRAYGFHSAEAALALVMLAC